MESSPNGVNSRDAMSHLPVRDRGVQYTMGQIRGRVHHFWNHLLGRCQVHMLHIGKTGGTAIKAALCDHADRTRYIRTHLGRVMQASFRQTRPGRALMLQLYPHRYTLRDLPIGDKFFFFVRDPLARFVSGFNSRLRQGQPRVLNPWSAAEAEAFSQFHTPNDLASALVSSVSAIRAAAEAAMRGITHIQSSYWDWFHDRAYFESRLDDVLLIGFQETLNSDFEDLKSLLELPSTVQLPTDAVTSHRSPPGLDRTLDATSQGILRQWYARDYQFVELCQSIRSSGFKRKCA